MEELKEILDKSRIRGEGFSPDEVPMQEIYKEIYDMLFKKHWFGKSYLQALKGGDPKEIRRYERSIRSRIMALIIRYKIDQKIISPIKHKVKRIFSHHIQSILNTVRPTSFINDIPLIFLAIAFLTPQAIAVARMADTPYVTENVRLDFIKNYLKRYAELCAKYDGFQGFPKEPKEPDLIEALKNKEFIEEKVDEFLRYHDFFNEEVWNQCVMDLYNGKILLAGQRLENFLRSKLAPDYEIKANVVEQVRESDENGPKPGMFYINRQHHYSNDIYTFIAPRNSGLHLFQQLRGGGKHSQFDQNFSMNLNEVFCGISTKGNLKFGLVFRRYNSDNDSHYDRVVTISLIVVTKIGKLEVN
ncbi:MAG: hypothetical protein QGH47_03445 [Candidatus Woesearchaeota archaeon]|nr:hypothetical protein [Candidatus Woesearchaeota archaeon]